MVNHNLMKKQMQTSHCTKMKLKYLGYGQCYLLLVASLAAKICT